MHTIQTLREREHTQKAANFELTLSVRLNWCINFNVIQLFFRYSFSSLRFFKPSDA